MLLGKKQPEWPAIQAALAKSNFVEQLLDLTENSKNDLTAARMKKVAAFTKLTNFTPSKALIHTGPLAKVLCEWVLAVERYYKAREQLQASKSGEVLTQESSAA